MEFLTSFYEVLGVEKNSSAAEIRSAYRKLAIKWHPDKWASEDPSLAEQAKLRFQQIQEAYSVLSDGAKRMLYDAGLYESSEDDDAFCDFLDEMASLMAAVRAQSDREDSVEDLHQMLTKMADEDSFWTGSLDSLRFQRSAEEYGQEWQSPNPADKN